MRGKTSDMGGHRRTSRAGQGQRIIALRELVMGATRRDAAARAGISERTLDRWTADPIFAGDLDRERRRVFDEAMTTLKAATLRAVTTLAAMLGSKNEAARHRAAVAVLSFGIRAHEKGELERRMDEIEKTLAEFGHHPRIHPS